MANKVPAVRYRERPPCAVLSGHVRAFFQFTLPAPARGPSVPALVCPALFADPGTSIVFEFVGRSDVEKLWPPGPNRPPGYVVGPMTRGWATSFGDRVDAIGVYLRAGFGAALLGVPPSVLADRIVGIGDLWGGEGTALAEALQGTTDVEARVSLLERALVRRLHTRNAELDLTVIHLAEHVGRSDRPPAVEDLADRAGLSRQQLTRRFRSAIGIPPKVFCRLSRFRRLVGAAGRGGNAAWADLAAACGYADQSHMIAEFRAFTGLTPGALFAARAFHPFAA